MARNLGVLKRQLFGNCSNPCAGLLHHHRKLISNPFQTLTLISVRSTTSFSKPHRYDIPPSHEKKINSPPPCKLPISSPNLRFMELSDSGIRFSSPQNMVIISNRDDYNRAIKEVKDGLLPAVFYCLNDRYAPVWSEASCLLHKLRAGFPHVTIYKVFGTPVTDMEEILVDMFPDPKPTFHFYQNGEKVAMIVHLRHLEHTFEILYRDVLLVESTQPTGSSGIGERRAQQLVIQAKKDENDSLSYNKGFVGGWKVGSVGALMQCRGAATFATLSQQGGDLVEAVESSTAPSLHEVMQDVESLPGGHFDSHLWWYARGLFKYQPKKRVMFSNVQGSYFKVVWLLHEMAEE